MDKDKETGTPVFFIVVLILFLFVFNFYLYGYFKSIQRVYFSYGIALTILLAFVFLGVFIIKALQVKRPEIKRALLNKGLRFYFIFMGVGPLVYMSFVIFYNIFPVQIK